MGRRPRIRGTGHIYQLSVFREGLGERLFFSLFFFSTLKDTTHFTNMIPAIGNEQKHRVSRRDSLWSFKKKMRQNLNFCRSHSLFITFLSSPQVVKKTTQPGRLVSRQIQVFNFTWTISPRKIEPVCQAPVPLRPSCLLYLWECSGFLSSLSHSSQLVFLSVTTLPKSLTVFYFLEKLGAIRREILKFLPTNIPESILNFAQDQKRCISSCSGAISSGSQPFVSLGPSLDHILQMAVEGARCSSRYWGYSIE